MLTDIKYLKNCQATILFKTTMCNSKQQSYSEINSHYKRKKISCFLRCNVVLLQIIFLSLFLLHTNVLHAHTPHDVISSLEISPDYHEDKTLFLIEHKGFMVRSSNGGFFWKKLIRGLDTTHHLSSIVVSPSFHYDKTLFLSTQGDGVFKSRDGGNLWSKVNNGINDRINLLSISTNYADDETVLAAGSEGGLYKTKDGGHEWYQVISDGIKIRSLAFSPDSQHNLILAGDDVGNLYCSTNNGEEWEPGFQIKDVGAITAISISPAVFTDSVVFAGTEKGGIFKSSDCGASFAASSKGVSGEFITSLAISPDYGTDSTVFASTWYEAVFKTVDGGVMWNQYNEGLTKNQQADSDRHRSPHFLDLRISKTFAADKTIFLGGYDGLFKSIDCGHNWAQMETRPVRMISGLGLSLAHKGNYTIALNTYGGGAYISSDQGKSWTTKNKGLITTRLFDITFSPSYNSDKQIFTGSMRYLLKSKPGNDNWERIETYKTNWIYRFCAWLESINIPFHDLMKKISASMFVKTGINPNFIALSPDFANDKTLFIGTRFNGVFVSYDGGLNLLQVLDGGRRKTTSLIISPHFLSDKTLFACLRSDGIYKSSDFGKSWLPVNNGVRFQKDSESLLNPDYLLAISPDYETDDTVYVGTDVGLFKTTSGGESWEQIELSVFGGSRHTIKSLAISPNYKNDKTIMCSVKGKGVLKSEDAGLTWSEVGTELINENFLFHFILFSPLYSTDKTVYGASHEELFRSTDSGNNWKMVKRPVRYENMRDVIKYDGKWRILEDDTCSAMSVSYSDTVHNRAEFKFVGTGVSWISSESNTQGIANVYVDGGFEETVDQYSKKREVLVLSFTKKDLPFGAHSIIIEVTENRNPKSLSNKIEIDAFDVIP